MLLYLCVTLPFLIAAWLVYSSRNATLAVGRWILRRRYEIVLSGTENIKPDQTYLVIPNHPAIVDPLLVVAELHPLGVDVRPLVDESFFSNRVIRHILALFDAVRVPDFRRVNFRPLLKMRPTLHNSARKAQALGYTVLSTLTNEQNVLLYPSGHITPDGRETMSNRQLAYNVISQLPSHVRVLGVRTRGLYGSIWSRVGGRPPPPFIRTLVKASLLSLVSGFRRKRQVTIHFEDLTSQSREWATGNRADFNLRLEKWYDADLALIGRTSEEAT